MSVDCQITSQSVERGFGHWNGTIGIGEAALATVRFETVNGRLRIDAGEASASAPTPAFVAKARPSEQPSAPQPPEPPAPPEPPHPPHPGATTVEGKVAGPARAEQAATSPSPSEILQRVERGEISVDDALKLLQEAR